MKTIKDVLFIKDKHFDKDEEYTTRNNYNEDIKTEYIYELE
jgi:hypothetical protein